MPEQTLSFDVAGGGFSSFWSYIPDWMVSMNNVHYSFKNGDLYEHNSNSTRNNYYGTDYSSTITPIFNDEPTTVKMFNTIALEGNSTWQADITSDLGTGIIETDYYSEKEGDYFAYIRRDANTIDQKAISTQGVGSLGSYASLVLTFGFNISTQIAIGDTVYINDGIALGVGNIVGNITAHTSTTITVDAAANVPSPGDVIVVVKDSTAESFGLRGCYMEVLLTNSETTEVELFSISSEGFKSYP